MAYDIQLLVQAIFYFLILILNFIVAIPIGVNVIELNNQCMLYSDINWVNATFFTCKLSTAATCHFPIYVAVTCIFYSLLLGVYNMYVVCRSKDANIGFQMWTLPFIVLTTLIVILMLVVSCILSVGIKNTCDGFMSGKDKNAYIESCSDVERWNWISSDKSMSADSLRHFYTYPKTSEVASWITFLVWTVQASLFVLRFFRNRRSVSKNLISDPSPSATTPKISDMSDFASVQPAA